MYGNLSAGDDVESGEPTLSPDQRRALRRDLSSVAARTREFLPGDFVVGSELTSGASGLEATIAVQPPVGAVVSAGYSPNDDDDLTITDDEREDLAMGLAASAALQVKQAVPDADSAPAQ
jgi:hypothetical protein